MENRSDNIPQTVLLERASAEIRGIIETLSEDELEMNPDKQKRVVVNGIELKDLGEGRYSVFYSEGVGSSRSIVYFEFDEDEVHTFYGVGGFDKESEAWAILEKVLEAKIHKDEFPSFVMEIKETLEERIDRVLQENLGADPNITLFNDVVFRWRKINWLLAGLGIYQKNQERIEDLKGGTKFFRDILVGKNREVGKRIMRFSAWVLESHRFISEMEAQLKNVSLEALQLELGLLCGELTRSAEGVFFVSGLGCLKQEDRAYVWSSDGVLGDPDIIFKGDKLECLMDEKLKYFNPENFEDLGRGQEWVKVAAFLVLLNKAKSRSVELSIIMAKRQGLSLVDFEVFRRKYMSDLSKLSQKLEFLENLLTVTGREDFEFSVYRWQVQELAFVKIGIYEGIELLGEGSFAALKKIMSDCEEKLRNVSDFLKYLAY